MTRVPNRWPPTAETIRAGRAVAMLGIIFVVAVGGAIAVVAGLVYAVRWAWVAGGAP